MFHGCVTLCLEELLHVWVTCSVHGRWEIIACITSSPCSRWTVQFNFALTHAPAWCLFTSPASKPVLLCFIFPGLYKTSLVCFLGLWSSLTCQLVFLGLPLLFSPCIPASASYPPLHAFLSVCRWLIVPVSLSCSCFLILSSFSNSFLPGTQLGSLLIPASRSCSLVLQQGAGSQGHSSLICLFVYIFIECHSSKISSSFLPSSSNIPARARAGVFRPGTC